MRTFLRADDVLTLLESIGTPGELPVAPINPAFADLTKHLTAKLSGMRIKTEKEAAANKEVVRRVHAMMSVLNASRISRFPNFKMHTLTSPTGYTAVVDSRTPFSMDPFVVDLFRVMAAIEVEVPDNGLDHRMAEFKAILKKVIPTTSYAPPNIRTDSPSTGWAPSLGQRGSLVGVYKMIPRHSGSARYFLVCNSTLPEQTLAQLHVALEQTHIETLTELGHYRLTEKLQEPTNLSMHTTFREAFRDGSVMHNARDIAVENAIRLLIIAARSLGLQTRLRIIPTPETEVTHKQEYGICEVQDSNPTSGKQHFRIGEDNYKHLMPGDMEDNKKGWFNDAINAWPVNAPIYPASYLPAAFSPTHSDYPLGSILEEARSLTATGEGVNLAFDNRMKSLGRVFIRDPETIPLCALNDVNTFRRVGAADNGVQLFMGCTPTTTLSREFPRRLLAPAGVMFDAGLVNGFILYEPNLLSSGEQGDSARGDPRTWTNNFGDAFPCVSTNLEKQRANLPAVVMDKFVSREGMDMLLLDKPLELSPPLLHELEADLQTSERLTPEAVFISREPGASDILDD